MDQILNYIHNKRNVFLFFIGTLILISNIFSNPSNYYFIESVNFFLIGIIVFLFFKTFNLNELKINKKLFILFFIAFFLFLVSTYFSLSVFESIKEVLFILIFMMLMLIFHSIELNIHEIYEIFRYEVYLAIFVSLIGLYFFIFAGDYRIASFYNNPNVLGAFLLIIIPISYFYSKLNKNSLWYLQFLLIFITFIFTFSRGAFLSIISAAVIFGIYFIKIKDIRLPLIDFKNIFLFFIILLLLIAGFYFKNYNFESFRSRFIFSNDLGIEGRKEFIQEGLSIFKDHTLVGSGLGSYKNVVSNYQISPLGYSIYPHNILIEFLSDMGILGIAILSFLIIFFTVIFKNLKYFKSDKIFYFLLVGLLGFFIEMFFEVSWHYAGIFYIFAVNLGILSRNLNRKSISFKYSIQNISYKIILLTIGTIFLLFSCKSFFYNYYTEEGKYYLSIDNLDKARTNFIKSNTYWENENSDFNAAFIDYATYMQNKNKLYLDSAKKFVDQSLRYNQNNAETYNLRGLIELQKNNTSDAKKYILKAIGLNKFNNPNYYLNLADIYITEGDTNRALESLKKILYYYPSAILESRLIPLGFMKDISRVNYQIAVIYYKKEDLANAVYYINEALKIDKENITAGKLSAIINNKGP